LRTRQARLLQLALARVGVLNQSEIMIENQEAKDVASGKIAAEPHVTSTPERSASQTEAEFAVQLWTTVRGWVVQKMTPVMDDNLKVLKIDRNTLHLWMNGSNKSLSTTMQLRNRILWLDTNTLVSLVRESSPQNYWQFLLMDRAILDAWREGIDVNPELTTTLAKKCKELCVKGVLYEYVKYKLGVFRAAHPNSILQYMGVDQTSLDEWNSGAVVSFKLTNSLRLRLIKAEFLSARNTAEQHAEFERVGAMKAAQMNV